MNELTPEILNRIDLLAAKFQTSSEHIYEVLLKQSNVGIINSSIFLGIALLIFIITISFCIYIYRYYKKTNDDDMLVCGLFIGVIGSTLSFFIFSANIGCLVQNIFNPEYTVIRTIGDFLR